MGGEAVLNLRRRVLPACEPVLANGGSPRGFGGSGQPEWATPTLIVPLTRTSYASQIVVVARVLVSFSVNVDPEVLLREARFVEQPFGEKITSCLHAPPGSCSRVCGRQVECRSRAICGSRTNHG